MSMGEDQGPLFRVWTAENTALGPVELPSLVTWVKSRQVRSDTWVFVEAEGVWKKADQVPELNMFFGARGGGSEEAGIPARESTIGIKPGTLRRIKVLADLTDEQLTFFLDYMEVQHFKQFATLVTQGDHGDAMYLLLEGEVRARVLVDGKESTLATLSAGDFFGEVSLLDHGPRSTDVVANVDSVLLKISADAFAKLRTEAPQLALPFLFALSKTLVGRLRKLTKRYEDSVQFSRFGAS